MYVRRLSEVLACELLIASEALEYAKNQSSPHIRGLLQRVRTVSGPLVEDRSTSAELKQLLHHSEQEGGLLG